MEPVIEFFQSFPLDLLLIQTVNGIVTGMILALVASGLTLIFGIMDVVNFAHGELFMLGAYLGVVVMATTGNFWLALVVATLVVAILGGALQIVTLRPLIGRDPLNTILVTFGISLILQNFALWEFGPVSRKLPEPITSHFDLFYLQYPWYRIVIAALSAAIIGGFWLFLKYSKFGVWIRATTQDRVMAQAMGIPVPWVYTGVFALGAAMAAASGVLFGPLGGVNHTMGLDWVLKAFIVVVVGGMGNLGGSIAAAIFISLLEVLRLDLGQPVAGGDRLLRRADPDAAVPSHRPVRSDTQMTTAPLDKTMPLAKGKLSHTAVYWIGFCAVMAVLIVAPLVLPVFWAKFLTEILIWGLLAMSSDLLIGYTGMISFGHSAFFGLGMYGAAGALLHTSPPNLWLAIFMGLVGAAGVALFVAYFSTRLRDIYFAITTLIFSQIFYVIIFTWTTVTGGENGLIFTRPHFSIPFLVDFRFTTHDDALVRAGAGRRLLSDPAPRHALAVRHGAAIDPRERGRTRAIGYSVERYKIVAVMLSGLFAGLAGVLYAIQNEFAAPDFVFFRHLGRHRHLQRHGRHRHAGRADRRRRFLPAVARTDVAHLRRPVPLSDPARLHLHCDDHLPAAGAPGIRAAVAE